eukprot:XP_019927726.1 PREDICTED: protein jagged-1b isoform X2 [Crassostrea gigas]
MSLSGNSVYPHDVLTVLFCLLTVSQAYVNVALNKPAYQQYPVLGLYDKWDASNAVDGHKSNLSSGGGQCAISYVSQTATWWVNLTTIHSIHHITIYFRTNNEPWGPSNWLTKYVLGFSVYVSNTTDRLQGTLCYKDDNFTRDTIPAVFTTTCPVHGQYVIYYNERLPGVTYPDEYSNDMFNGLCEVEVYACDRGSYGYDCKETCGHCRDVSQCSNINGWCLTGCDPGYQGDLCKTSCDRGSYASECNETCGHCRDVDHCSNINGTCLTGCDVDYQGDLCKTLCPVGYFGQDCSETCINSYTCDGCNDVSGSCDYGCRPGWIGYFCQKSTYSFFFFFFLFMVW